MRTRTFLLEHEGAPTFVHRNRQDREKNRSELQEVDPHPHVLRLVELVHEERLKVPDLASSGIADGVPRVPLRRLEPFAQLPAL